MDKDNKVVEDKNIDIKVISISEHDEVTVEINGIKTTMTEDDGMIWFSTTDDNYKTIVFPTAESLLKAIQTCYIARTEKNNNEWIKNHASVIKQALKAGYDLETIAKFCRYSECLLEDNIITEEQFDELYEFGVYKTELGQRGCYAELEGLFLSWKMHCFFNNMHHDYFVKDYYEEVIKPLKPEEEFNKEKEIESIKEFCEGLHKGISEGILTEEEYKEIEERAYSRIKNDELDNRYYLFKDTKEKYPWYSDHGEWYVEDKHLLYHLSTEDREIAIKEINNEGFDKPMFYKALAKILEEILELADKIEE